MAIHLCKHCGNQICSSCGDGCTKIYCGRCSTIEKRMSMDEENRINFEKNGLIFNSPCEQCKNELEKIKCKDTK